MLEAVEDSPVQSAFMGWDWRHVAGRARGDAVAELAGFPSFVEDVGVTAAGDWVVAIAEGGRARVWSLGDRREAGSWVVGGGEGQGNLRCGMVVHPTEALVFAGHEGGGLALHTVPEGRPLWSVAGVAGGVVRLAVSADGRRLATAGLLGRISVWGLERADGPVLLRSWESGVLVVRGLGLSPDGSEVCVAGPTGQSVRRFDLGPGGTGEPRRLPDLPGSGAPMAVSGPGRVLATSDGDGRALLRFGWPGPGPGIGSPRVRTLAGAKVSAMALAAGAQDLAIGFDDGRIWWWRDSGAGEPVELLGHVDSVIALGFTPDGRFLVSGGHSGGVRLWDADAAVLRGAVWSPGGRVHDLAFAPDSRTVVTVSQRNDEAGGPNPVRTWVAEAWDLADPRSPLRRAAVSREAAGLNFSVGVSTDGTLVAVDDFERLEFCRIGDLAPVSRVDGRFPRFDPAGGGFFFVEHRRVLWASGPGNEPRTVVREDSDLTALAVTADRRVLATAALGDRGTIRLREAGTGRVVRSLEGHRGWVSSLAFTPDGTTLASAGWDEGLLRVWDVRGRRPPVALRGHNGGVFRVVFSPDGTVAATCGHDDAVRLWQVATRQEVAVLRGHRGAVKGLAFSPDGRWLASASEDGSVRLWLAPLEADLEEERALRAGPGAGAASRLPTRP